MFPYTREGWTIVDVVPFEASYSKIFRAGMLVSYVLPPTAQKTSYFDNYATNGQGVALVKTVDLTDPAYTTLATLAFAGIITHSFPENRPALGDQYGDLELEDRDLAPLITTIAGPMARTSMALAPGGLILCPMWNPLSGGSVEALAVGDIGKPVYVSRTDGGSSRTGAAGYGSTNDHSALTGTVRVGVLIEIPVIGGAWGYIQLEQPTEMA